MNNLKPAIQYISDEMNKLNAQNGNEALGIKMVSNMNYTITKAKMVKEKKEKEELLKKDVSISSQDIVKTIRKVINLQNRAMGEEKKG